MREAIQNLKIINLAQNYNTWIYQIIKPFLGKRILEVGCGTGNMSQFFLNSELLVGIDISADALDIFNDRLGKRKNIKFFNYDIMDEKIIEQLKGFNFDTVILINVLEHIKDDFQALINCSKLISLKGKVIIFAPAFECFYGSIDKADLHFRRYKKNNLAKMVECVGLTVKKIFYKDLFAIPLWILHNKVLRTAIHPSSQISFFDKFVPLCVLIEKIFPPLIGLSIVCIGERK